MSRIITEEEGHILTQELEVKAKLMGVHSGIKDRIKEDYTLAKWGTSTSPEQQFVEDRFVTAEFANNCYLLVLEHLIKKYKNGEKTIPSNHEGGKLDCKCDMCYTFKKIELARKRTAEAYLNQLTMMAVIRRNVKENYLMQLIGNGNREEEEPKLDPLQQAEQTIKEGIRGKR